MNQSKSVESFTRKKFFLLSETETVDEMKVFTFHPCKFYTSFYRVEPDCSEIILNLVILST